MYSRPFDPARDRIRRRIFPADAVSPKRSFAQVLAIITDDAVFLYREGRNGRVPETVFSQRLDDMLIDPRGVTLTLADGEKLVVKSSSSGCGCGSRLKHWLPTSVPTQSI